MEEQNGAYTRKIGKTTFVIGLKSAEKAKGTLNGKLERMLLKKTSEFSTPLSHSE